MLPSVLLPSIFDINIRMTFLKMHILLGPLLASSFSKTLHCLQQWLLNFHVHTNTLEDLLKQGELGLKPWVSDSAILVLDLRICISNNLALCPARRERKRRRSLGWQLNFCYQNLKKLGGGGTIDMFLE